MKQCIKWKFETLREVTKFTIKFYEIQEIFFPDNIINTVCVNPTEEDPTGHYIVHLKDKPKFQRKAENETISDNEGRIARYDTVSFAKQIRSNQYPDKNSWMRKMKPIKMKGKK
tara:strand:+ start:216 stop:557 length:342 start_codon:yes stop_codon:yes gene_type:complete